MDRSRSAEEAVTTAWPGSSAAIATTEVSASPSGWSGWLVCWTGKGVQAKAMDTHGLIVVATDLAFGPDAAKIATYLRSKGRGSSSNPVGQLRRS